MSGGNPILTNWTHGYGQNGHMDMAKLTSTIPVDYSIDNQEINGCVAASEKSLDLFLKCRSQDRDTWNMLG